MKNKKISASLEDYLEAIFNLTRASDVARSRDIADVLGVSRSSVTGALRLLKKKGLVNYQPYGYITLTDDGGEQASEVAEKHRVIKSFFVDILGIEPEIAQEAACRAEHALGGDIISRLMCFVEYMTQQTGQMPEEFKNYCSTPKKKAK